MALSPKSKLPQEAAAAWREWKFGAKVAAPCLRWATSTRSDIGSKLAIHREDAPVELIHRPTADGSTLTACLADLAIVTFLIPLQGSDCSPKVTWKSLVDNRPMKTLAWERLARDPKRWPNHWLKSTDEKGRYEAFVSSTHPQGLVAIRVQEAEVVRHYSWMRTIHGVNFGFDGHLAARFLNPRGHTIDVDTSLGTVDQHACIHGMLFPDEYLKLSLSAEMNDHFRSLIARVIAK